MFILSFVPPLLHNTFVHVTAGINENIQVGETRGTTPGQVEWMDEIGQIIIQCLVINETIAKVYV